MTKLSFELRASNELKEVCERFFDRRDSEMYRVLKDEPFDPDQLVHEVEAVMNRLAETKDTNVAAQVNRLRKLCDWASQQIEMHEISDEFCKLVHRLIQMKIDEEVVANFLSGLIIQTYSATSKTRKSG